SLASDVNACFEYLDNDAALELFATEFAGQHGPNATLVYLHCFHERGKPRLGFFTLLAACGVEVGQLPQFRELAAKHADVPLPRHLALSSSRQYTVLQRHYGVNWGQAVEPDGGFFGRLAELRDIQIRAQTHERQSDAERTASRHAALDFVRRNTNSSLGL